jgi:hypothetical protein
METILCRGRSRHGSLGASERTLFDNWSVGKSKVCYKPRGPVSCKP